jgi:hypothetical protein
MLLPAKQLVGGGEVGTILVGDRDGFDDRDGSDVGDRDGFDVGDRDGFDVGDRDGFDVGDRDGLDVGDRDGLDVGDRDGRAMGVIEGTLDNVGELVIVGDDDGENAGFGVTVQVALSLSKSTLE